MYNTLIGVKTTLKLISVNIIFFWLQIRLLSLCLLLKLKIFFFTVLFLGWGGPHTKKEVVYEDNEKLWIRSCRDGEFTE